MAMPGRGGTALDVGDAETGWMSVSINVNVQMSSQGPECDRGGRWQ